MSAIILESRLVHYEALGRGKPLLFLHDWLGSWRYWVPTMLDLGSSYRAYALDFWGFGDSDRVSDRYNVEGYVDQVALFLDHMGISSLPVIGHGLGGVVGLHLAKAFPDRVEQVMVANVPLTSGQIGRALSGYTGGENPAKVILGRRLKAYEEVDIEAAKTDGSAVASSVHSVMDMNLGELLEDIDMPVLLVSGQEDPIILPPDDGTLAGFDYNVFAYTFETAQHYPMLDETTKFNRLLKDFLTYRDDWDSINVKEEWKRRMR